MLLDGAGCERMAALPRLCVQVCLECSGFQPSKTTQPSKLLLFVPRKITDCVDAVLLSRIIAKSSQDPR